LLRQLRSAVEVPIDRHSDASLKLLDEAVRQWRAELRSIGETSLRSDSSEFRIIEISMARPRDAASKDAVQQIPTGLVIKPEQIDLIRRFVRRELELNPEWQTLMRELQVDSVEARSVAPAGLAGAQQH
jgi:hypothetical protein